MQVGTPKRLPACGCFLSKVGSRARGAAAGRGMTQRPRRLCPTHPLGLCLMQAAFARALLLDEQRRADVAQAAAGLPEPAVWMALGLSDPLEPEMQREEYRRGAQRLGVPQQLQQVAAQRAATDGPLLRQLAAAAAAAVLAPPGSPRQRRLPQRWCRQRRRWCTRCCCSWACSPAWLLQ